MFIKKKLVNHYLKKAKGLYADSKNISSIKYLDKVLAIDKNNVEALCLKGLCYSNMYDKENSFKCFEKALDIDPSDGYIYLDWGFACSNLDEFEMALKYHTILLDNYPEDPLYLQLVGSSNLFMNNIDEAFSYFNKAISQKKDAAGLVHISKCYRHLENYDESLKYLNEALKIDENNEFALMEKCEVCIICEKYENALSCVDKTLKLNPSSIFPTITKNYILFKLKRYEEALNGFKKISEIQMEDSVLICSYYRYYGAILQDLGKYGEALDLYEEYLEKYPHFPKEEILEEKEEVLKLLKE